MKTGKAERIDGFRKRIAKGDVLTLTDAAKQSGYSRQHLRRLCFRKRVEHIRRGPLLFFTANQASQLVKTVGVRA